MISRFFYRDDVSPMIDPTTDIRLIKSRIREDMVKLRKNVPPRLRMQLSERIAATVLSSQEYQEAEFVLLYASFREEVETDSLIREVLRSGRCCSLPRVTSEGLETCAIRDMETDIKPSRFRIREPIPERCQEIDINQHQLLLLPGIAFDYRGTRLGFGAGHYDRYLAGKTSDAPVLGLAFSFQTLPEIPRAPHDIPLDGIITDEEFLRPWSGEISVNGERAMEDLGAQIGARISPPASFALIGDLGAGKTTFTRGLLRAWNASENAVSPTYLLVNEYQARVPVRHLDAYRLDEKKLIPEDVELIQEALDTPGYSIMEWADRNPRIESPHGSRQPGILLQDPWYL